MAREIERKFRVIDDSWRRDVRSAESLRQGYLAAEAERSVRVRIGAGGSAWLTVKGATHGATREEFEYAIPEGEAEQMLALCLQPVLAKTRHRTEHAGREWLVDEFHGAYQGLVLAEIELESEHTPFERPPWLGAELTGDPRYHNANLVRRGLPCQHPSCGCGADPAHGPFCGGYCANAAQGPSGACSCEHRACSESQRVRSGPEEPRSAIGPDPAGAR